jgi:hypothetical protein
MTRSFDLRNLPVHNILADSLFGLVGLLFLRGVNRAPRRVFFPRASHVDPGGTRKGLGQRQTGNAQNQERFFDNHMGDTTSFKGE